MSLLKCSLLPQSDGPLVPPSSIVAVNRQAWGKDNQTLNPSAEHMKASPPRRHRLENGLQSTVWQRQFTTSLTNWMKVPRVRLHRVGAPNTGSFLFILLISWLLYMYVVGVNYLRKCVRYVNGHSHADWIHCSTKVFFTKFPFFANSRKFSTSKVSRYTVYVQRLRAHVAFIGW